MRPTIPIGLVGLAVVGTAFGQATAARPKLAEEAFKNVRMSRQDALDLEG